MFDVIPWVSVSDDYFFLLFLTCTCSAYSSILAFASPLYWIDLTGFFTMPTRLGRWNRFSHSAWFNVSHHCSRIHIVSFEAIEAIMMLHSIVSCFLISDFGTCRSRTTSNSRNKMADRRRTARIWATIKSGTGWYGLLLLWKKPSFSSSICFLASLPMRNMSMEQRTTLLWDMGGLALDSISIKAEQTRTTT
jgi:hypothetical protein